MLPTVTATRIFTLSFRRNALIGIAAVSFLSGLHAEENYERNWDAFSDTGAFTPHQPTLQALMETRTLVLSNDVNANASQQLIAGLLLLDRKSPGTPIDLYIRSNGGWTSDVFAIIDVIETIESPVNTYAVGDASSAGAMLVAAGTGTRTALPNSTISIHDNIAGPEEDDQIHSSARIDRAKELAFWSRTTKLPKTWFKGGKDVFYSLDPETALRYGVIDTIAKRKHAPKVKKHSEQEPLLDSDEAVSGH